MRALVHSLLGSLMLSVVFVSGPADAQRRIVGGDELEDEDKIDKEAAERAKKKREAEKKKQAALKAKKDAEKKKKREEKKKAREAARKKAEEERKKKAEDKERKALETAEKEKKRLEGNREARLLAAKKSRKLTRRDGKLAFEIRMLPGQVEPEKLVEVKIDISEELEVRSAQYGMFKPLVAKGVVAEVNPPDTGAGEESTRYRVHALRAPGKFGFHFTPAREGEHPIRVEGKTPEGRDFSLEFSVFSGEWPPPDFESEERNNAASAAGGSGRRVAGGG